MQYAHVMLLLESELPRPKIEPPISCPKCERLFPSLLKSNKENSDLMRLKAKEGQRIKFVLGVSWLLFLICVFMW
ncbi:hypothetical protein Hanom_Chr12g01121211 [Helianthus anomalus]